MLTRTNRSPRSAVVALSLTVFVLATGLAAGSGPNGSVRGYVTDSISGVPVPGASVRVDGTSLPWVFETTTDVAGYFQIAIPAHRYTLFAHGPAHLGATASFAVGSGGTTWVNVTLPPAASRTARLQGFVTDSITAAPVTAGRIVAGPPSPSTSEYTNSTALNATGFYSMDLVPWAYEISTADAIGWAPYANYPIAVSAGQVRWLNITLDPNPVDSWINGTVRDRETSAPIMGARITARVDGLALPPVTTDVNGFYALATPAGDVDLIADADGYAPVFTLRYIWSGGVEVYEDFDLLRLGNVVHGFVLDGLTGAVLPGASVVADPFWSDGYFDQVVADGTGYYSIILPEDDFTLTARLTGYTTWTTYILYWSGPVLWANATLWPIVSTISGYLFDASNGNPIPGLAVHASDVRSAYSRSATADGTGFFTLPMTPSPAISLLVYATPVYAGNVVYAATRPYETTWVNVTLDRLNAQLVTTVTDAITGLALTGAGVSASWTYGWASGATDGSGVARVDVPAGLEMQVAATATGYLAWNALRTTVAGPNPFAVALYPDLAEDVTVRGYVRDGGGAGIWPGRVDAFGYGNSSPYASTDFSGYYEMYIVARPQTLRARADGFEFAEVSVAASPGAILWVNFTLPADATAPQIRTFLAIPATGISETMPAALAGDVNETSLDTGIMTVLMLRSVAGNVGTFLMSGRLPQSTVSVTRQGPDTFAVGSSWDTRTRVGRLSDGGSSVWWPITALYPSFLVGVGGYWDNATVSPTPGVAMFDGRDGRLLYVSTSLGILDPRDQPGSTFAPYASAVRIDLTSAAIVGASLEVAPAFAVGSLSIAVSSAVPSGQYAILLEVWDMSSQYDAAVVLVRTGADTVPPVAVAGADRTVDEDVPVAFDGTGSTDNVGIATFTWVLIDGTPQVLSGPSPTYTFATPGTYTVTLTVEDADGNAASDSMTVVVRDATPPSVSIVTPSEGAAVSGSVTVSASAADNVGIVRVEFFLDGAPIGTDTTAPFAITFSAAALAVGNHTIDAVAFDATGLSATTVRHVQVVPGGGGPGGGTGPASGPTLVLVGVLALLGALAVGVALLLRRRRRRGANPVAPAEPRSPVGREPPR